MPPSRCNHAPFSSSLPERVILGFEAFDSPVFSLTEISLCDQNAAILPARHALRQDRKAPAKLPPPEDVIVLSSDSEQSRTQSESSASSVRSRRKAINTLSSVLSARSKVRGSVKRLLALVIPGRNFLLHKKKTCGIGLIVSI